MIFRRAIAASVAALSIGAVGASTAQAANYTWAAQDFYAGMNLGGGSYTSFTRSEGYAPSGHSIRVGARTPNGVLYGSWVGGSQGSACHLYGANTLQPLLANTYSTTFKIYGYVGTGAGQSC